MPTVIGLAGRALLKNVGLGLIVRTSMIRPLNGARFFGTKYNLSEPPTNPKLIVNEFLAELPSQRFFLRFDLEPVHVTSENRDKNKGQRIR